MNQKIKKQCIVIAPCWPSDESGYGIAIKSSLKVYREFFDQVLLIVITENENSHHHFQDNKYKIIHIKVKKKKKWTRFLKSLFSINPASVIQFSNKYIIHRISNEILNFYNSKFHLSIIFEDIPISQYIGYLKNRFDNAQIIVRSHNVFSEIFEGFENSNNIFMRYLWKFEQSKCFLFEKKSMYYSDTFFAISNRDAVEYKKRYKNEVNGILGIYINSDRYKNISGDDIRNILYLGSADLRKAHGIKKFIDIVWNDIYRNNSKLKLTLGGRGTEKFNFKETNINGLGFVIDDASILNAGMIFINPQERGSGIKIKSIIAMSAGKVLISTTKGLEGIDGENGKHFFCADTIQEMGEIILFLQKNKQIVIETGYNARILANDLYDKKKYLNQSIEQLKLIYSIIHIN